MMLGKGLRNGMANCVLFNDEEDGSGDGSSGQDESDDDEEEDGEFDPRVIQS